MASSQKIPSETRNFRKNLQKYPIFITRVVSTPLIFRFQEPITRYVKGLYFRSRKHLFPSTLIEKHGHSDHSKSTRIFTVFCPLNFWSKSKFFSIFSQKVHVAARRMTFFCVEIRPVPTSADYLGGGRGAESAPSKVK